MQVNLRVISGPFAGKEIPLEMGKFLIGREKDCHLQPESEFVSRHHCVLLLDPYALRVRDLGSKNGTMVNGRRVQGDTILVNDDMVGIGEMTLQVGIVGSASEPDPATSDPTTTSTDAASQTTGIYDGNTVQEESPQTVPPANEETLPLPETPLAPTKPVEAESAFPSSDTKQMPNVGDPNPGTSGA